MDIQTSRGFPQPFGATLCKDGINFSIYLKTRVAIPFLLCLFTEETTEPVIEIPFDPSKNRTGKVWHICVHNLPSDFFYAFRYGDQPNAFLLDPYAKAVYTPYRWGQGNSYRPLGAILRNEEQFDWQGVETHAIPFEDLIIYELHVRGFTQHPSSGVKFPGTYSGIIEKIPYLKSLGINAVELMPIHEFNENENPRLNLITGNRLYNFWGYSSVNYFSPMSRYASSQQASQVCIEFKTLVRELHRAGIEVILDVVFNHTAEDGENGPTYSFKGLDRKTYYILDGHGAYLDFTGCGNTFNANHPIGRQLIIDSLRYWALEMHIDGFRFDLASTLGRDRKGVYREENSLIEAITLDPLLSNKKLIAEPWDASGMYQVGNFFPQIGRWAEWNGKYRDCIRRFIKGDRHCRSKFATRLCGSQDLYGKTRKPYHSINFIVAHDGFTLADLVAYQNKHNEENGENNRDGLNYNDSWNCGVEGKTEDQKVLKVRLRQMRNFIFVLMVSQGTPMLLMGDEYGHTKKGNNNSWCQDNVINWFLWDNVSQETYSEGFSRFYRLMIQFRREHRILHQKDFLTTQDVIWHGIVPERALWNDEENIIAFTLIDPEGHDIYIAFNNHNKALSIQIPKEREGRQWMWVVDTYAPTPYDFIDEEKRWAIQSYQHTLQPFSAMLLIAG